MKCAPIGPIHEEYTSTDYDAIDWGYNLLDWLHRNAFARATIIDGYAGDIRSGMVTARNVSGEPGAGDVWFSCSVGAFRLLDHCPVDADRTIELLRKLSCVISVDVIDQRSR
jgi:hypothetical protein